MNVLVVGCGKVGSQLCNVLSKMGHDVSVIDPLPERFDNLADHFTGYTVVGVPLDQDVLRKGGIEGCDAVAAVTNDDNMNVMVCQLASEIFNVPRVLARIYDPRRSNVFSHFGLHTVCPTNLSVDAIYSMLTDRDKVKNVYLDSATVSFDAIAPTPKQIGMRLYQLSDADNSKSTLFGLLHADGNLTLAFARANDVIGEKDRLLYAKVID
ncbi:TrkA family potassium uptake protein [Oscillospiraceae bacterium PP1C4]